MPLPERRRPDHGDDDDDDVQYLSLDRLVRYSGLSLSTVQRYCKASDNPLPHLVVRSPGKTSGRGRILVPKRQFDEWMQRTFAPRAPSIESDIAARVRRIYER